MTAVTGADHASVLVDQGHEALGVVGLGERLHLGSRLGAGQDDALLIDHFQVASLAQLEGLNEALDERGSRAEVGADHADQLAVLVSNGHGYRDHH